MIAVLIIGLVAVLALAYWNGANDVSKTIATIVGGKVSNYRRAVILGATFNAIGTFLALFFAQALYKIFTSGLLKETQVSELFTISVIIGAVVWIIIATRLSMPVSTTHSIIGAILFLGIFVYSFSGVLWGSVLLKIALPLILSPFISFFLAYGIFWLYSKNILGLKNFKLVKNNKLININNGHWLSCAASSFARGMNDGPKFVALAFTFLLASQFSSKVLVPNALIFLTVALAMGLGGYFGGYKVTKTLGYKITKIGHTDGFIANLITSLLVTSGAYIGLPMSTTHVSSFAIIGIGSKNGKKNINWKTVKEMALSWLVTLPISGMLSIATYLMLFNVV